MKRNNERSSGQRGESIIDSIDISILSILKSNKNKKGIGVMELRELVDIPHKTMKPHLDKLIKFKLVDAENLKGRRINLKITDNGKNLFNSIIDLAMYKK